MFQTIDEAINRFEKLASDYEFNLNMHKNHVMNLSVNDIERMQGHLEENRQLAEWLRELKRYRKQIQNLIDNESFEIVNPFNTYEYARVVRVADLYDLIEVNADEDSD